MNVDDIVAEHIAAARIRIAAAKRRRDELAAARRRGLAARHAQKLRNLDAADRRRAAANKAPGPGPVTATDLVVARAEKGLHSVETPTGSIRAADPTPDLTKVQQQLERIADRLDNEETR